LSNKKLIAAAWFFTVILTGGQLGIKNYTEFDIDFKILLIPAFMSGFKAKELIRKNIKNKSIKPDLDL
jgi:hypothetical protein